MDLPEYIADYLAQLRRLEQELNACARGVAWELQEHYRRMHRETSQ